MIMTNKTGTTGTAELDMVETNASQHTDIVLKRDGVFTRFSTEIAQLLQDNSGTAEVFTMRRFLLEIEVENDEQVQSATSTINRYIRSSSVCWNTVDVYSSKVQNEQPKVFNAIKPAKVLTAARKAGLLPSSKPLFLVSGIVVSFLSGVLTLLVRQLVTGIPSGADSFREMLLSPAANGWYLTLWGAILFSAIGVVAFVAGKMVERNVKWWRELSVKINNAHENERWLQQFSREIVNEFSLLAMPRMLFVDAGKLDKFSTSVLSELLKHEGDGHVGLSVWIIFMKTGTASFRAAVNELQGKTNILTLKHKVYHMIRTC